MLAEQGLGKYCDPDFVRYTSREMQEALDMTREEMDLAAHQLLQQERRRRMQRAHDAAAEETRNRAEPRL